MSIQIKCRECECLSLFYGICENIKQKLTRIGEQTKKKERKKRNKKNLNKRNRKNQSTTKIDEILTTILSPIKALIKNLNSNKTRSNHMKKKLLSKNCQWKTNLVK